MQSRTAPPFSYAPSPQIHPIQPPARVIQLCRQLTQRYQEVENEPLRDDESDDYKQLYEQKCSELIGEISRGNELQKRVFKLQEDNRQLQIQIRRLQEDKWQKCSTFRQSENRKRSKSFKKAAPTIEVKVPSAYSPEATSCLSQSKSQEMESYIKLYQQEIAHYKDQVQRLTKQISILKSKEKQSDHRQASSSENQQLPKKQDLNTHSPSTRHKYLEMKKEIHPTVSDFSPGEMQSVYTIKKDRDYTSDVEFEIKRLKNELLYKELLLDKLKQENLKENSVLQKHLKLSVEQSRKVADQTAALLATFKQEIVDLCRQLDAERSRSAQLEEQLRYFTSSISSRDLKARFESSNLEGRREKPDLLGMLKHRRVQKMQ